MKPIMKTSLKVGLTAGILTIGSLAYSLTKAGNDFIVKVFEKDSPKTAEFFKVSRENFFEVFDRKKEEDEEAAAAEKDRLIILNEDLEENPAFVILDTTGKVIAKGKTNVEGGDDTTQVAVRNLLNTYLTSKKSRSDNFKEMISRLSKINEKYPTIKKLKSFNGLKQIGGSLEQTYSLVNDEEKKEIAKIAAQYNEIYGMNISDLAKKVVEQESNTEQTTDNPTKKVEKKTRSRVAYHSVMEDDVKESEKVLADAKAEFQKSLTQGREKILAAARKLVNAGGNPADIEGWEEISKELNITPDDLAGN